MLCCFSKPQVKDREPAYVSPPRSGPPDATRISKGQDPVRISKGQDAARISKGQDAARVSKGQDAVLATPAAPRAIRNFQKVTCDDASPPKAAPSHLEPVKSPAKAASPPAALPTPRKPRPAPPIASPRPEPAGAGDAIVAKVQRKASPDVSNAIFASVLSSDTEEEVGPEAPELETGEREMLQDIHFRQAAGITQMLTDVKETLMEQQTLTRDDDISMELNIGEKIGGGGFGEVFKGEYKGKDVAVKLMKIKNSDAKSGAAVSELPYKEAAIAGVCVHPNIVSTLYSDVQPVLADQSEAEAIAQQQPQQLERLQRGLPIVKEWQVRMVMERCDLGSVRDWVSYAAGKEHGPMHTAVPAKGGTKGCDRTLCALLCARDVAKGIKLLHKYKILHGDLKPHNVLLQSNSEDPRGFVAKLSDFGLSLKMAAHDGKVSDIKYGTVQYLSAEVLRTHIMTKKADVYSFGIIMWELWHSKLFAEFYNVEKKKRGKGQGMDDYRPAISSKCPKDYKALMTRCWSSRPEKRPDFVFGDINIVEALDCIIFNLSHRVYRDTQPSSLDIDEEEAKP